MTTSTAWFFLSKRSSLQACCDSLSLSSVPNSNYLADCVPCISEVPACMRSARCHIMNVHFVKVPYAVFAPTPIPSLAKVPIRPWPIRSVALSPCGSFVPTLCLKKGPTCKLSVTLSNLNRFSKFLHYWKAYKIRYKTNTTLPTSP